MHLLLTVVDVVFFVVKHLNYYFQFVILVLFHLLVLLFLILLLPFSPAILSIFAVHFCNGDIFLLVVDSPIVACHSRVYDSTVKRIENLFKFIKILFIVCLNSDYLIFFNSDSSSFIKILMRIY